MATQDEIMAHILQLVGEGAGMQLPLPSEVELELRAHYYGWIKTGKNGATITPLEIWDGKEGRGLQRKFREIGEHLAKRPHPGKDDCVVCYRLVEKASLDCPHCPDPPPGG